MSASGLYAIEKLDDTNYVSWAVHMKSVLVHSELWAVISGKLMKNEQSTPEEAAAFDVKDEKALASILLCIKPSQVNHVRHCQTAVAAWNKLKDVHQPGGPARKVTLFRQLLSLSFSEDDKISNHITEFYEINERLAEIGVLMPEEVSVIILLASLPKSYENFVVAIESRDSLPSLNILKVKLLEEGARRNAERSVNIQSQQALVAKAKFQKNPSSGTAEQQKRKP